VRGAYRVGVFARCVLKPGEEITVDYNLESWDGKGQECNCGNGVSQRTGNFKRISLHTFWPDFIALSGRIYYFLLWSFLIMTTIDF
jgi:hypothetical protein